MGDKFTVSGETVSMLYPDYGVSNPSAEVSFPYQVVRQTTAGATPPSGNFLYWGADELFWGADELQWGS